MQQLENFVLAFAFREIFCKNDKLFWLILELNTHHFCDVLFDNDARDVDRHMISLFLMRVSSKPIILLPIMQFFLQRMMIT